jgi:hypothetical protein
MRQPETSYRSTSLARSSIARRIPARVGLGIPHSVNDVEEEVRTLHAEMMQFGQELRGQLFLDSADHPRPGVTEDKIALYQKIWRPLMLDWLEFHEAHKDSFWQNLPFSGAWDRIVDFRQKLIAIRNEAKKQQFKIASPDPIPPQRDLDVGGAVKVAVYVAIGIGGLVALRALTKS